MRLSTRTRYGMRAAFELARHYGPRPEPLGIHAIAKDQEVSAKYLEQVIAVLKVSGVVRSVRGAKGGYVLAKSPKKIKLSEIFNALEGAVTTVECVHNEKYCDRSADCVIRNLWKQLNDCIDGVMESMTLQDLLDREKKTKADYQI